MKNFIIIFSAYFTKLCLTLHQLAIALAYYLNSLDLRNYHGWYFVGQWASVAAHPDLCCMCNITVTLLWHTQQVPVCFPNNFTFHFSHHKPCFMKRTFHLSLALHYPGWKTFFRIILGYTKWLFCWTVALLGGLDVTVSCFAG